MEETYTCEACGGVFLKLVADEEALEESRKIFGDYPMEDLAVICDPCWRAVYAQG